MDFKEILVEAYRKKECNGRYEFSTGKILKLWLIHHIMI